MVHCGKEYQKVKTRRSIGCKVRHVSTHGKHDSKDCPLRSGKGTSSSAREETNTIQTLRPEETLARLFALGPLLRPPGVPPMMPIRGKAVASAPTGSVPVVSHVVGHRYASNALPEGQGELVAVYDVASR